MKGCTDWTLADVIGGGGQSHFVSIKSARTRCLLCLLHQSWWSGLVWHVRVHPLHESDHSWEVGWRKGLLLSLENEHFVFLSKVELQEACASDGNLGFRNMTVCAEISSTKHGSCVPGTPFEAVCFMTIPCLQKIIRISLEGKILVTCHSFPSFLLPWGACEILSVERWVPHQMIRIFVKKNQHDLRNCSMQCFSSGFSLGTLGCEVCRAFLKNGQLHLVALGLLPGHSVHAFGLRGSGLHWILCTSDTKPGVKCSAARSTRHGGQWHGPGCFALWKWPDAWPCAVGLRTAQLRWCRRCGDPCA